MKAKPTPELRNLERKKRKKHISHASFTTTCTRCKGHGEIVEYTKSGDIISITTCRTCNMTGKVKIPFLKPKNFKARLRYI